MNALEIFGDSIYSTIRDVLPLVAIIAFFQLVVLRRPLVNLPRLVYGWCFVVIGLSLFLTGLKLGLFPLGEAMAGQLLERPEVNIQRAEAVDGGTVDIPFYNYYWTYLFAFAIGVSTTIAEPALIAVAMKAEEVSGGTIQAWGLRLAVALGVGVGVAMGTLRIVLGTPLPYFIITGYVAIMIQTCFAPKQIVPLAYDSGGVTTSTVTVPLIAALGLGLASRIPGRDPVIDGFGLIAFASLFPMMTVMGYAQLAEWFSARNRRSIANKEQTCTSS